MIILLVHTYTPFFLAICVTELFLCAAYRISPQSSALDFHVSPRDTCIAPHSLTCSWKVHITDDELHNSQLSFTATHSGIKHANPAGQVDPLDSQTHTMGVFITGSIEDTINTLNDTVDASNFTYIDAFNNWVSGEMVYYNLNINESYGAVQRVQVPLKSLFTALKQDNLTRLPTFDSLAFDVTTVTYGYISDDISSCFCSFTLFVNDTKQIVQEQTIDIDFDLYKIWLTEVDPSTGLVSQNIAKKAIPSSFQVLNRKRQTISRHFYGDSDDSDDSEDNFFGVGKAVGIIIIVAAAGTFLVLGGIFIWCCFWRKPHRVAIPSSIPLEEARPALSQPQHALPEHLPQDPYLTPNPYECHHVDVADYSATNKHPS